MFTISAVSETVRGIMDWKFLFFAVDGRIGRQSFWIGLLFLSVVSLILEVMIVTIFDEALSRIAIKMIAFLVTTFLSLPLWVKRLHDRNKSAWWLFLLLVPVVGLMWAAVEIGLLKGTRGSNRYGDDPLALPSVA